MPRRHRTRLRTRISDHPASALTPRPPDGQPGNFNACRRVVRPAASTPECATPGRLTEGAAGTVGVTRAKGHNRARAAPGPLQDLTGGCVVRVPGKARPVKRPPGAVGSPGAASSLVSIRLAVRASGHRQGAYRHGVLKPPVAARRRRVTALDQADRRHRLHRLVHPGHRPILGRDLDHEFRTLAPAAGPPRNPLRGGHQVVSPGSVRW